MARLAAVSTAVLMAACTTGGGDSLDPAAGSTARPATSEPAVSDLLPGSSPAARSTASLAATGGASSTTAPPFRPPDVYLSGPFGTMDGVATVDGGWVDAARLRSLDPLVESAPLDVGFRDLDLGFESWRAMAAAAEDPDPDGAVPLGVGPAPGDRQDLFNVSGPRPGDWIVRVEVTPADGRAAAYHWRLAVPERPLPEDGMVVPPLPDLLVAVAGTEIVTTPFNWCYVAGCGGVPRPRALDLRAHRVAAGGDVTGRLSDGSAFVAWGATAEPAGRPGSDGMTLAEDEEAAGVSSVSFRPPGPGDWIVAIRLTFDLERGAATYHLRLIVT